MKEKKERIVSFINSLEGEQVIDNAVVLGGASGDSDDVMTSTNSGSCTNVTPAGCNKSTNALDCKNVKGACESSKNGGDCNNGWELQPVVSTSCSLNGTCQ